MRDLLQRHVGGDRIGREHEHDSVGAPDQRFDALPPILEGINLGAVDQRLEAARLKRRFKPIREGHVLARIGDEDSGLRPRLVRWIRLSHPQGAAPHQRENITKYKE